MEVCCQLRVVPQKESTVSHTFLTQHASVTASLCLRGTYYGLHYRLARVNAIGIHWDLGNCQQFDQNGDLLPL